MLTPSYRALGAVVVAAVLAVASSPAYGRRVDDYASDNAPRALARAYFSVVSTNQGWKTVARNDPSPDSADEGAYYTEGGGISIPPRAMIVFKNAGKCMDPHLPAPRGGEPMQFVDVGKLIPQKLRPTYDRLIERSARGDPNVAANNLQHLVWALRTAGTEDPIANNLTDAQIELLDECAGRRGAFMRYHEREKARNARRSRKGRNAGSAGRISVGGFSYDASDLRGTNGVRRIESHIATLTEMGEKSKETTSSDFRYGEIDEELYSDVVCDGGLSFTARILNASERRREFRAADFAAQVGNGMVAGSRRQRVTMGVPDKFAVVMGAVREGVEIDRGISAAEIDFEDRPRVRGRGYRRRAARAGEGRSSSTKEHERKQRTQTEITTTVEEVTPVPPVPPVPPVTPVVIRNTVTNEVPEDVNVRVMSLSYDDATQNGVLTIEIASGSFKDANAFVRQNFEELVRKRSIEGSAVKIPEGVKFEIESITITESNRCEIKFKARGVVRDRPSGTGDRSSRHLRAREA